MHFNRSSPALTSTYQSSKAHMVPNGSQCMDHYRLGKGGYVFDSVDLFVCKQHCSKSYGQIAINIMEGSLVLK